MVPSQSETLPPSRGSRPLSVKLFYTGPAINAEMLVVMLEKHGIIATMEPAEDSADDDLNRQTKVLVPEAEYDRAWRLFYAEREDEL